MTETFLEIEVHHRADLTNAVLRPWHKSFADFVRTRANSPD